MMMLVGNMQCAAEKSKRTHLKSQMKWRDVGQMDLKTMNRDKKEDISQETRSWMEEKLHVGLTITSHAATWAKPPAKNTQNGSKRKSTLDDEKLSQAKEGELQDTAGEGTRRIPNFKM